MSEVADAGAGWAQPGGLRAIRDELAARVRAGELAPLELPGRYAGAADELLRRLLDEASGGDPHGLALVAVGGYGRSQLSPGSDLDVVLLHHKRKDVKQVADHVWYAIWDTGVRLDHSVRTHKEAIAVANADLRAVLGLLDGRVVAGDAAVAAPVLAEVDELWRVHARRYLPVLARASEERGAQFGEVPFLLEPDLKEARGGLRDLDSLAAAARALPALASVLSPAALDGPRALLLGTRVVLHACTGNPSDRLLLQDQDQVAPLLGFGDADELMAHLAAAGREVLWTADDTWRRVRSQMAGPRGRAGGREVPLGEGLVLSDDEIALGPGARPGEDVSLVWRAASAAAERGVQLAPSSLDRLVAETPPPLDPWPEAARDAFVALLGSGQRAVPVLEALDQRHLLERFLPEWGAVRNRPQRNAFHRYTVDRHLLEAAACAAGLVREVSRPDLLLLGALLHDIGKGYPGDHSAAGAAVAEAIATRLGLDAGDVAVLGRLVELHLLLPDTATRRDLDDPATIETVAKAVGDRTTLELLGALAEADGLATGSTAWGPWKAGLVTDLVRRVDRLLAGEGRTEPVSEYPTAEQQALVAAGRLAVTGQGSTVTVVAPDRPALLAAVAGTLALHRMEIRRAVVLPGAHGMALEVFDVVVTSGETPSWERIEQDLAAVLDGRLLLEARLSSLRAAYARRRTTAAPSAAATDVRVIVDNDASATATVLEVRAPDDTALLHRLTGAIAAAGLDVASALVSTLGQQAVDVFYVHDAAGAKLVEPARLDEVAGALAAAAAAPG